MHRKKALFMKHIEVSRKINLTRDVSPAELKDALLERLAKVIMIEESAGDAEQFTLSGTSGPPRSLTRHARLDLSASINYDSSEKVARIILSGYGRTARSLVVVYFVLFFALLLLGLLPGSVSTSMEESGPMDALIFLLLGVFIIFDTNKKLADLRDSLNDALASLDTAFG